MEQITTARHESILAPGGFIANPGQVLVRQGYCLHQDIVQFQSAG